MSIKALSGASAGWETGAVQRSARNSANAADGGGRLDRPGQTNAAAPSPPDVSGQAASFSSSIQAKLAQLQRASPSGGAGGGQSTTSAGGTVVNQQSPTSTNGAAPTGASTATLKSDAAGLESDLQAFILQLKAGSAPATSSPATTAATASATPNTATSTAPTSSDTSTSTPVSVSKLFGDIQSLISALKSAGAPAATTAANSADSASPTSDVTAFEQPGVQPRQYHRRHFAQAQQSYASQSLGLSAPATSTQASITI